MEDEVSVTRQVVPRKASEFFRGSFGKQQTSVTVESLESPQKSDELPSIHEHKNRKHQKFSSGLNMKQPSFSHDESSAQYAPPTRLTEPNKNIKAMDAQNDSRSIITMKK